MKRRACIALALGLLAAPSARAQRNELSTTVGVPGRIEELVLPGGELEVAPHDPDAALVVRILRASPHGTAHRYDLEYWAYEAGEHDLRSALRRKDGSSVADLPPIPVHVASLLAPGALKPSAPPPGRAPRLGGYRALLWIGGGLWVAGLAALLLVGRARRREERALEERPLTLADRLRPLVERALANELTGPERAALELSLVAYWRRRLGLEEERPERALELLHQHAEAGPLLRALEDWLHRPAPTGEVDLAKLLAPYRDLPPDALELAKEARRSA